MNLNNIIKILFNQAINFAIVLYVYNVELFGTPYVSYFEMNSFLMNLTNLTNLTNNGINNGAKPNKLIIDEINSKAYFFLNNTELFKMKISQNENFINVIKPYYDNFNNLDISYQIQYSLVEYIFYFLKQIIYVMILIFVVNYLIKFISLFFKKLFVKNNLTSTSTTSADANDNEINIGDGDDDESLESSLGLSSMLFSNNMFKVTKNISTKFADVIGQDNVKNDLKQYIDFLKNRSEYVKYGAKIPKGLLFTGQPGTGKTLLAKALAGESKVNFISASGSDFVGMYVGLGQQRVKQIFNLAKKNTPCIIFIDEIDSIGKNRNNSKQVTHVEHSTTLNQLLVQMDGFVSSENIIIIGATNMKDTLDPALLRSGRFDRNIVFDLPNINERKQLFELYMKPIVLHEDIKSSWEKTISDLSKLCAGLSGADIANIVNQSVINSLGRQHSIFKQSNLIESDIKSENRRSNTKSDTKTKLTKLTKTKSDTELTKSDTKLIELTKLTKLTKLIKTKLYEQISEPISEPISKPIISESISEPISVKIEDIMKAIDEIIVGFEKRERLMSLDEKRIVSYHEAGHCLLAYLLEGCSNPIKVSIVPRGDAALGFSQSESDDRKLWKKSELIDRLCMIYGGRIAEEIKFDSKSITTGASDDIEKATKLAYSMVTKYGFYEEIGQINYGDNLSQQTQHLIDTKVKDILSHAYNRGKDILKRNNHYLEKIAHHLLEKEILYASDLEKIMNNKQVVFELDQ